MKNNWKDDFDKRFASMYLIADERIIELNHNLLKGFISNILAEQKKELLDSFLKVVEEDITRNQERGFPTSALAKQWVLTQLKHHE